MEENNPNSKKVSLKTVATLGVMAAGAIILSNKKNRMKAMKLAKDAKKTLDNLPAGLKDEVKVEAKKRIAKVLS